MWGAGSSTAGCKAPTPDNVSCSEFPLFFASLDEQDVVRVVNPFDTGCHTAPASPDIRMEPPAPCGGIGGQATLLGAALLGI